MVLSTEANINFEKNNLKLGPHKIMVEIADTDKKTQRGLMFRRHLKENEGMLFIFKDERHRSFWMKNTFIDLSIGFFSSKRELTEIYDMLASKSELTTHPDSCETKKPAQFALEMSRGWFEKHNIKVGTKLEISTRK
jgi:uncharacterized membrane protein (UPF0127 family)